MNPYVQALYPEHSKAPMACSIQEHARLSIQSVSTGLLVVDSQ